MAHNRDIIKPPGLVGMKTMQHLPRTQRTLQPGEFIVVKGVIFPVRLIHPSHNPLAVFEKILAEFEKNVSNKVSVYDSNFTSKLKKPRESPEHLRHPVLNSRHKRIDLVAVHEFYPSAADRPLKAHNGFGKKGMRKTPAVDVPRCQSVVIARQIRSIHISQPVQKALPVLNDLFRLIPPKLEQVPGDDELPVFAVNIVQKTAEPLFLIVYN